MTGEELYGGWARAATKLGKSVVAWPMFVPRVQAWWERLAGFIGNHVPASGLHFLEAVAFCGENWFGQPEILSIADELVSNWVGYFDFTSVRAETENTKGDVWLFKASGLKATVLDVDGTKLKLKLQNGTETDWLEASEVVKGATKETK